ncbi:putative mRNA decapping enzyme [Diachasmimorpha longicaudata entomopoxvirus]|uniref:Putative mRNA decapping enzyme n=1 Tax=Diachasmimorpha longicaudata entomopoxvirus TaxID=109981 RepID=A0A7R5WM81_9POXV|nr:putative mRNA decapping enzyme [Diachasmimorpha longicaudata entomopoxvirus]AKS26429.1 putative mRNA decapping enzyme [Diachasmimorpha longicaudata entomopoxvirus]
MVEQPFYTLNNFRGNKKYYIMSPNYTDSSFLQRKKNIYSYNVFLITKDNKLALCKRRFSFYLTYIYQKLFNRTVIMPYEIKIISKCLINLPLNELLALEAYLTDQPYNHTPEILKVFTVSNFKLLNKYPLLLYMLKNKSRPANSGIILPGGKKKTQLEDHLRTIKRELYEETNIDLTSKPCYILNNSHSLQKIDWLNPETNKPLMIHWSIYDKVLQKSFYNISYIIHTDFTSAEILQRFSGNCEISNMVFKDTPSKKYDKIGLYKLLEHNAKICC